jgi:hypothetical protein
MKIFATASVVLMVVMIALALYVSYCTDGDELQPPAVVTLGDSTRASVSVRPSPQTRETNIRALFRGERLVQAYSHYTKGGEKIYVLVFMNDSTHVVREESVSPGVFYTYYNLRVHEGFIIR